MGRLIGNLYAVGGSTLTHYWDANAYLVAGDEPTLIDCGSVVGYSALKKNLQSLGYEAKDIKKVIATHGHFDHVSAMALLRQESDAKFYIHKMDREQVETGDPDKTASFLYNEPFPQVHVDGELQDGEVFNIGGFQLQVIHTPGHSPGSLSFYVKAPELNFLIAGDTLWGGYHPRVGSDIDKWGASLDRLLELDFDALSWGHGQPTLIYEAKVKVAEARQQLGIYFNPWFKPFYLNFRY